MQIYSLISSLNTYHPNLLYFTPGNWTCAISIHGEHTVLQPFRRIELVVHIVVHISVLQGTHSDLSLVKHVGVKCLVQGHKHRNSVLTLTRKKCDISPAPSGA